MKNAIQWAVNNAPAVNTLMVAMIIVGALSASMMRREVFPEFELEMILVTVPYPGATPAEVEEGICQKIEEACRPISGIKKQTAIAQEGSGYLVLELNANVPDVQKVLGEVRSAIDRIPSFPELAEDAEVKQLTLREPAIRVGVVGPDVITPQSELELREVTEQIRTDLLQLPPSPPAGVLEKITTTLFPRASGAVLSQANIIGAKNYQIDIEIPEPTLRKHGMTLRQVAQIVRRENIELPGGSLKTENQEVLLRGKNRQLTGDEIAKIPVITDRDGAVITIGDLGSVRDEFEDTSAVNMIDGRPGLVISIDRTSDEDLLAITGAVKHYVATKQLPAGYELRTWADRSVDVRDRMDLLVRNGTQGLILVFLTLALFLELRLAFWVAMGIPLSMLGTCVALLYMGQTLNMLSMFAFLMALGIVVDDAIVIGENIYAHRQAGKSHLRAAIDGTVEVVPSVLASVGTTVIAFVPLLFVSGIMGKFIAIMPIAIILILLTSLFEATFMLPVHLAHEQGAGPVMSVRRMRDRLPRFLKLTIGNVALGVAVILSHLMYPLARLSDMFAWLTKHVDRLLHRVINEWYVPAIRWTLHNPAVVVCTAVAVLMLSMGLVQSGITPFIIFPKLDSPSILSKIVYPDGTPERLTADSAQRLEDAIRQIADKYQTKDGSRSIVKLVHRAIGQVTSPGEMRPDARTNGSHVGVVNVELVDPSLRDISSQRVLAEWRALAGEFPGAETLTFGTPDFGPGGTPIEFKLLAGTNNIAALEAATEQVKARLTQYPGVFDVGDDSRPGKWEFQLRVKPRAAALGIPLADLAETVRASYYGEEVMRLQRGRHEVKLMVRYPREDRHSLADFQDVRIRTADGAELPVTELAEVHVEHGYSEINRIDQQRAITVSADVDETTANAHEVVADLRSSFMPELLERFPGVSVRWEGQQEQTSESVRSMMIGFGVAMVAMFVLLTMEFRSYFQPFLILMIIPFGVVGAIWGHALLGLPMTMFSLFGLVALSGVVVNDSIVLIDFINSHVREGMPVGQALVEAGRRRFRAVLLTSVTTVAGLLPLVLERSFQAQILVPMATSLCFGLMMSTTLVLFLVPTFYYLYVRIAVGVVDVPDHDIEDPPSAGPPPDEPTDEPQYETPVPSRLAMHYP